MSLPHSPYSARVRIQIRKKQLPIDIVGPDEALRTVAFFAKHPLGKLPILVLDDGTQLPESSVILEYLEDAYPDISLRPKAPLALAQMRLLTNYADNHLAPLGLFPVFKAMMSPGEKDLPALLASLSAELAKGEQLLTSLPCPENRDLHLGDIALVPSMAYVIALAPALNADDLLAQFPKLQAWWSWANAEAAVAETVLELMDAYRAFAAKR